MPDSPPERTALGKELPLTREFWHDHEHWKVTIAAPGDFDRRSSPRLVFETDYAVRAVSNFPANWYELSDEELYQLSWSR